MRHLMRFLPALACAAVLLSQAAAQPPGDKPAGDHGKAKPKDYSNAPLVTRMMAFDKNKDGKLTRDEITDPRLLRLFDRADTNKDGVVTKEELMALAAKLDAEGGPGGRGFGGPGGPGGPGGRGFGGPGGRGFGGPPRPGQVLPPFVQERLNLTADQKKQLDDLQKDVDARLGKILSDEQKKQLHEMQGGFGRGGRRGPGGPGGGPPGPPPDGDGGRPGRPGGN
jgi:hypothetical protein